METSNKVSVKVGPLDLHLVTTDSSDYIKSLGEKLNSELEALMSTNSAMTLTQAFALLALYSLDEAKKACDSADNLRGLLKSYLEDVNKYRASAEDARKEAEKYRALLTDNGIMF